MGLPPVRRPIASVSIDRSQLSAAAAALGISLLSAAIIMSAMYSRQRSDLDASNFTMGVLSTLGLLSVSAGAAILLPRSSHRSVLVSWSGAAGVLGTGLMLAVLIDDDPAALYAGASVVVAMSVAGYLTTRAASFVLTTIAGLALLYGQVFDDVIDVDGDGTNTFMIVGAAILVFVVVVTAAGWWLPDARVLSGVVVGAGGLAAFAALFQALMFARVFTTFGSSESVPMTTLPSNSALEGGFEGDGPAAQLEPDSFPSFEDAENVFRHNPYRNDVYVILGCCAVLAALWLACSLYTGHVGFRILVLATAVEAVPMATMALFASHPTWWEVVAGALGAVVLVGSTAAAIGRPTAASPAPATP